MSTPTQGMPLDAGKIDQQLQDAKDQLGTLSQQLTAANNKLKTAKTKQEKAVAQAQVKFLTGKKEILTNSITKLQNQYYEATGDYEKLLEGADRDAYLAVSTLFKSYGLESLAGKVFNFVKNGYSADTIQILLQDTPEYKQRFAGNEVRKKNGLPVLSPGEYLSTEAAFRQVMESAGLPVGFYDQPSDFETWIGKNVSATEIQSRVDLATQATVLASPAYRRALNQIGISDKELTAYFLDPNKALPYLQKSAATAAIGAQAISQGLAFDTKFAEQLATEGITADEAKTGYAQIAAEAGVLQNLAGIYGEEYNQRTAEEAILQGKGSAINARQRLINQERGQFSGSAGSARSGLAQAGGAR